MNSQIRALETGLIPWRKLWHPDPNRGGPTQAVSGVAYWGIDFLTLQLAAVERKYLGRWWGTWEQWKKLGGTIRGIGVDITGGRLVFNLDRVEGDSDKLNRLRPDPDHTARTHPDFELAQAVVDATKADIRFEGVEAFYKRPEPYLLWPHHVDGDFIQVPRKRRFVDTRSYFETLFHELIHWSEIRRGWKPDDCVKGELIAEIGCCFLANELNIPHSDDFKNHFKYVDEWVRQIKNDRNYLFHAAKEASEACRYILSFNKGE